VGDVDTEAVHPTVKPEPQDAVELVHHLRVLPVQVRLLLREQMQIPLPVRHPFPRRAAEHRRPVVRWHLTASAAPVPEDEPGTLGTSRLGRERGLEPRVLVGEVIGYDVYRHPQPPLSRGGHQRVEVGERAEHRVDVARVGDVVAAVRHR
jgi:hypothetical protein